jgi:hypothetical protein
MSMCHVRNLSCSSGVDAAIIATISKLSFRSKKLPFEHEKNIVGKF